MYCKACKYWTKVSDWGQSIPDEGQCSKILYEGLEVAITSGWDGHVIDAIETEENFGCVLHEER